MIRRWECVGSKVENFTVNKIYETNGEGRGCKDDNGKYLWETSIQEIYGTNFKEVKVNKEKKTELVNHPKHYNSNSKGIEVIDVIEAFTENLTGIDAFDIGTAIKYLGRLGKKDEETQEVKKAIWYLQHYVDRKEDKENDNN